jgi:hypothetical protein
MSTIYGTSGEYPMDDSRAAQKFDELHNEISSIEDKLSIIYGTDE